MSTIIVGVGGLATSNLHGEALKTIALGSCVGVIVLAPRHRAVGLLHVALPESKINTSLAVEKPGYFADTGIPLLLNRMASYGCMPNQLIVKLAGGANIMDPDQNFSIGKRNLLAVKKILWRYNLGPIAEEVGENISRTVSVSVDTGRVTVSSPGRRDTEI